MEIKKRYIALDVFRGLTVAMMILVNNPGSWAYVYAPLEHSKWNGCTPTDLVFPFFMFAVGLAMAYAFAKYDYRITADAAKKVVKRSVLIFAIGLFLQTFPQWEMHLSNIRIMGVLQRIAIAYLFASFIVLGFSKKAVPYISGAILLGYWALLYFGGGEQPYTLNDNVILKFDLLVLGSNHLYQGFGIPFDPEGLIGVISSTVTVLLGYLVGLFIKNHKKGNIFHQLLMIGAAGVLAGLIWNFVFPINKALWTSSYVLYTAGLGTILLGVLVWIIDQNKLEKWANPFIVFGMNPLFLYSFSWVLAVFVGSMVTFSAGGNTVNLSGWFYERVLVPIAGSYNGSLIYAILFVGICWLVGYVLYKRKIFIKV